MFKKSKFIRNIAVVMVISISLSSCAMPKKTIETEAQITKGVAVEVEKIDRSTIQNELTYIGQIAPQLQVSVVSKLAAEVKEVYFDIGDTVEKGDVLFSVDAKDIQDQVRQLQAAASQTNIAVNQAEYGLETAKEGSKQERLAELQYETQIDSARYGAYGTKSATNTREGLKDAKDSAEANYDMASSVLSAEKAYLAKLVAIGVGNAMEDGTIVTDEMIEAQKKLVQQASAELYKADAAWEQAQKGYDSAKIGVANSDNNLNAALESYDVSKEVTAQNKERSQKQAEFAVQNAQAAQNNMQVQLSIAMSKLGYADIKSPISGVISTRAVEIGQTISQVVQPFTIIQMDKVNVEVNVSEVLINSIKTGDLVQVIIQSIDDNPITGVVTAVSPAAGMNSTYPVKIELDNSDGLIKPGMFSQVIFVKDKKENVFVVNKNVILKDESEQYVYIVSNGVAKRTVVTTGLASAETIEILTGISPGDEIVVVGQDYLRDNIDVNIVKRDGVEVLTESITTVENSVSDPVLEVNAEVSKDKAA